MKILTANFLTCAVKACKSSPASYPLHFQDAELEQIEMEYNPQFLRNILPRLEWGALRTTAAELGFTSLPEEKPEMAPAVVAAGSTGKDGGEGGEDELGDEGEEKGEGEVEMSEALQTSEAEEEKLWRDLHKLLLETSVVEGKMVCGNCGHEYKIKEGIANFLLPNHLV